MAQDNLELAAVSSRTAEITRGTELLLQSLDYATLAEFRLGNGRRVDVAGLGRDGKLVFVEIKSSAGDFRSDRKWPTYLDYCDAMYFGVAVDFPLKLLQQPAALPETTGIIVADRYGGAILRQATFKGLNAARRRAETLRFARRAAGRLNIRMAAAG